MTDISFTDAIADPTLVSGFDPALDRLMFTNFSATQVLVLWAADSTQFVIGAGTVTLPITRDQLADGANISFADGSILTAGDDAVDTAGDSLGNAFMGDTVGVGSQYHGLSGAETVHGGSGGDLVYGNKGDDVLLGGGGPDSLYGGQGNDSITGWGLNDNPTSLAATASAQLIYGNLQHDTMISGDGDDIHYGGQGDDLIYAHGGNDVVYGNKGDDVLLGGGGPDSLYGGQGDDTVMGATGDDLVYGNLESDSLDAGGGADTIYGGQGDDLIIAGTGNDLLLGNRGSDTLTGGDGDDLFVFTPGNGTDVKVVTDYLVGVDGLDIRRTDVSEINIVQEGADVRVTLGSLDQILFKNTAQADILAEMTPYLDTVADGVILSVDEDTGGGPIGAEFQVNTYTAANQELPSVTALADGGFVVTWESGYQDGSVDGIYGQRYNADGTVNGPEFQVNTYATGNQLNPSVTALADGGFVVTWSSDGQDGDLHGIYGQRYNADGTANGPEFQVNTYAIGNQTGPNVSGLADGGFVVTWVSVQLNLWGDIYGQRFNADGSANGAEFQVNSDTDGDRKGVSVTALADGGFVATWTSDNLDGGSLTTLDIYGQRYNADGTANGAEFKVNTYTASDQREGSVTALADGGFVVIWDSQYRDDDLNGIYGQRYDADGSAIGSQFQIYTFTSNLGLRSSATGLADGGFVVTWHSYGDEGDIHGQRYSADGSAIGSQFQVNTHAAGSQFDPSVTALADGGFVVTWESYEQDGSWLGVYGQRFSPSLEPGPTISLTITANQVDQDGSETLSVTVAGMPAGASLSAGTDNGNGSWTLTETDLPGLTLTPAADFVGTIDLTITATATEIASGDTASATETLTLVYGGFSASHSLAGSAADDTMTGGLGDDTMSGLAGADRFRYTNINYDGHDVITDFTPGVDHIDMDVLFDNLGIAVGTRGPYLAQDTTTGDLELYVVGYRSDFSITLTGIGTPITVGTDIWLGY